MKYLDLKVIVFIFFACTYAAVAAFYPVNRGMVNQVTYVTSSGSTTTAVATSNQVYVFEGATTETLKLPNATGLPIDWWYKIVNNSTGSVSVTDNSGGAIGTVSGGRSAEVYLKARASAAGTWKYHSGVGTGDLSNYYLKSEFIASSAGVADAGKPIKTNASGQLDSTFITSLAAGITQLTGDVTAGPGTGSVAATVAAVGGSTAANVATAEALANAATNLNTASAIVKRDGSGNFVAGTITAALTGNASTASALAANPSDCGAGTKATAIAANGDLTCSAVTLTSDVSGTLPVGNGGTGQTTAAAAFAAFYQTIATTLGDLVYGGASGTPTRLAGNTTTTRKFLTQTGDGANSAAPAWNAIATSDTVALVTTYAIASNNTTQAAIDWNQAAGENAVYTHTMGGNMTFTHINARAGQTIVVRLTNNGSNYTAAWSDARLKWPAGTTPTLTTGAKSDVCSFVFDGSTIYGSCVQNF